MSWFRKTKTGDIPVVPDDAKERKAAIIQSAQGLKEALERKPEVERIAAAITEHDRRNHYRDRLYKMAYGEAHQ